MRQNSAALNIRAGAGEADGSFVRFGADFASSLSGFDLETLETDPHIVFALSPELRFTYFNPAWVRFAVQNDGAAALGPEFGLGACFIDALPEVLREFYRESFRGVLETMDTWHHDFECSSPELFRSYHQAVYPFRNGRGLLVVNSLIEERRHLSDYRRVGVPDVARYQSPETGLITQCCNCRRVQRIAEPEHWDWVPAWVRHMPCNITGGLCLICHGYYWRDPVP